MLVHIAQDGVMTTDVFRKGGNYAQIKDVMKNLMEGKAINFHQYSFHTLAAVVKVIWVCLHVCVCVCVCVLCMQTHTVPCPFPMAGSLLLFAKSSLMPITSSLFTTSDLSVGIIHLSITLFCVTSCPVSPLRLQTGCRLLNDQTLFCSRWQCYFSMIGKVFKQLVFIFT